MEGHGHYLDWYRREEEKIKQSQAQRGLLLGKPKVKKDPRRNERATQEEIKLPDPPEHFDLEPLKNAVQLLTAADSKARLKFKQEARNNAAQLESCFKPEDGPVDPAAFNVNTTNFTVHLEKGGLEFEPEMAPVLGPMLRCFGLLATKNETKHVQPPQPIEEEKKAAAKPARGARGRGHQEKEQKIQTSMEIECGVIVEFQKNKEGQLLPAEVTLMRTSLGEVLKAVALIEDYDKTLHSLGLVPLQEDEELPQEELEDEFAPSKEASVSLAQSVSAIEQGSDIEQDEYRRAVAALDDLEEIPEPPEEAKNAFCLVLYCLDEAFEPFGIEFLAHAFEQFPQRDYMIITQPHTVPENSLMKFFTHIAKKPHNTFSHVLYVMHRDCLLYQEIEVRRAEMKDLAAADYLISTSESPEELTAEIEDSLKTPSCPYVSFSVKYREYLVGLLVMTKDVNIRYYQSHFQIENYLLLEKHPRGSHTALVHSVISPIFLKLQTLIVKDVLRLMNKTCMYFEIHDLTVIPSLFVDLLYARSRKFPHLLQKPWDHEKAVTGESSGDSNQYGVERNFQDELESDFTLCLISKKHLSQPKLVVNHRIVVVGASDTGISFIEALLSNMFIQFNNIYLVAPGGLLYYHTSCPAENMKANSLNYSLTGQMRLLLESRVAVIDGRMLDIDREEKQLTLHDGALLKYDFLVLTLGLQDCTLQEMGRVSRGIAPVLEGRTYLDGVISIDDPYLFQHFRTEGNIMAVLNHRKMPGTTVVYGYTLHAFCCIQGLLSKGISPNKIKLVVLSPVFEYDEGIDPLFGGDEAVLVNHPAFEGDVNVQQWVLRELERLGIAVFSPGKIVAIEVDDKGKLTTVQVLQGDLEHTLHCKVLVTAGASDVDLEIFKSIHNHGLVFNGRVIVNNQFMTTDENIFAGGSLCEFSQQYKHMTAGRCLRMDRYNGKEVGISLARSLLGLIDLDILHGLFEETKEEIPYFFMPRGKGGVLPGGYYYYYITAPEYADPKPVREAPNNRSDIVSDTLTFSEDRNDTTGHYIKFTFNNFGTVQSVTYLSKEPVEIQSLWRFVGLSESYLNKLYERFENKLLPNVAEFLSENWAMALYHDWFPKFSADLKTDLKERIQGVLEGSEGLISSGGGLTREQIEKLKAQVPQDTRRMIQESTINYIKSNLNHMPMYYIPGVEFP